MTLGYCANSRIVKNIGCIMGSRQTKCKEWQTKDDVDAQSDGAVHVGSRNIVVFQVVAVMRDPVYCYGKGWTHGYDCLSSS